MDLIQNGHDFIESTQFHGMHLILQNDQLFPSESLFTIRMANQSMESGHFITSSFLKHLELVLEARGLLETHLWPRQKYLRKDRGVQMIYRTIQQT